MNNKDLQNNYVAKLFDPRYTCEITKVNKSILDSKAVNFTQSPADHVTYNSGSYLISTPGVTVTEINRNDEGIQDMLLGRSRSTTGEEFYANANVIAVDLIKLSAASIADILYNHGSVSLVNSLDSVSIYNDINSYIGLIGERSASEPHYQPPPEEDINCFKALRDMLASMATNYMSIGKGDSIMSKLIKMSAVTATSKNAKLNKVRLNGSSQLAFIDREPMFTSGIFGNKF